MKKVGLIFALIVFLPSLVLAWLAVRSLQDTQIVLERQEALIYQGLADALNREVNLYLGEVSRSFRLEVESALLDRPARDLAAQFHELVVPRWSWAKVGFAVSLEGDIYSPQPFASADTRTFLIDNDAFLSNQEMVEAYWLNNPIVQTQQQEDSDFAQQSVQSQAPQSFSPSLGQAPFQQRAVSPPGQINLKTRNVLPKQAQGGKQTAEHNFSRLAVSEAEFRQLIGDATEGSVARFLQNRLNLMFWYRPDVEPGIIFGAQIDLARLRSDLAELLRELDDEDTVALLNDVCVALLDETGSPVAITQPAFQADWKHPFVATELGEILPHWELGVYLVDPARLVKTANLLRGTLLAVCLLLLLAIGVGGWLIVNDLKRQLLLARQKTDFVSNVSHELKTPLTSIRMFSELLSEGRVQDSTKQRHYLQIITAEAARLTRLINNVLDFARIERGEKKYQLRRCDLGAVIRETADTFRPHLEANGFQFDCSPPPAPLWVTADPDALAQVLVNLLSNAEKYSPERKEIQLTIAEQDTPLPHLEVRVADRGMGVPKGSGTKIFEQFYRAHDSLNSGVQGSGLGLTLARQIARAHGGEIVCESREHGGSCFVLRLPRQQPAEVDK